MKALANNFCVTESFISFFYLTLICQKLTEGLVLWFPIRGRSSGVNRPAPAGQWGWPIGPPAWCFSNKWPVLWAWWSFMTLIPERLECIPQNTISFLWGSVMDLSSMNCHKLKFQSPSGWGHVLKEKLSSDTVVSAFYI